MLNMSPKPATTDDATAKFRFVIRRTAQGACGGLLGLMLAACASAPSATATPLPTATNSGPPTAIIITAPPQTMDFIASLTPIPTDTPAPTLTPSEAPPTLGPTITSSGPTVAPQATNAEAFVQSVPTSVGPFQIYPTAKAASANAQAPASPNLAAPIVNAGGSAFYYRTSDGALYQVVLWLTGSAQDAFDHFNVDKGSMTGTQTLQLGDEGYYSMVDLRLMVIIRYRNMVIDIYRPVPNSTVPTVKPTDQQVKDLATQIFGVVPKP